MKATYFSAINAANKIAQGKKKKVIKTVSGKKRGRFIIMIILCYQGQTSKQIFGFM